MKLKEVMTSMDYEKLYKAYYLQVYSYTISLAKNREIAEEITQNTFYKAVSTTSQFKGKSDELTWLCSIAGVNQIITCPIRKVKSKAGHIRSSSFLSRFVF